MYARNYFLAFLLPYAVATALAIFVAVDPGASELMPLVPLVFLVASVAPLVLVYRLWSAVQHPDAPFGPGMAVAGLFIPVFNLYWVWRIWSSWPEAFEAAAQHKGAEVSRVGKRAFSTMATASIGGPFLTAVSLPLAANHSTQGTALLLMAVGGGLSVLALVLFFVVVSRACRGVRELRAAA